MENKVKTLNDAISVLVQGVQIGQAKGVYSFDDSAIIKQALDFLQAESQRNIPETEGPASAEMSVVNTTETVETTEEETTE